MLVARSVRPSSRARARRVLTAGLAGTWSASWGWPCRVLPPGRRHRVPWVTSTAPIAQRVAQLMSHMSLADEIFLVEGHGTTNEGPNPSPNPYVFWMPGIPSLCIPKLGEEDGPAGVADQLTGVTQLPAGVALAATFDRRWPGGTARSIGIRGARQGRRRQPRPDGQHRPRSALGALVRGLHRGPVPRTPRWPSARSTACRARARCRRSSTSTPTTRRPTATPRQDQRHRQRPHAARDLHAGVPGRGRAGQRRPR